MTLQVHQFPCLADNYGYLVHDFASGETVAIDTPDGPEYLRQAEAKGWRITQIWNTHWHPDHAGGNEAIQQATGCAIVAPAGEQYPIFGVTRAVAGGDTVALGAFTAAVIDVGGHTLGHVAYHLPAAGIAFTGDALFALGCGRMFEGTAPQFWASLLRLRTLPDATLCYCAHEYTLSNARFAVHADPDNAALAAYAAKVEAARAEGHPTVPFQLGREKATNPFLRADDANLAARWGKDAATAFAALREAKNGF
jgi:hydroxyacylglutathione hydrolase